MRDRRIADGLFIIQIVGATVFGIAQFRVMQTTVEGVSTPWFVFWLAFLLVNLGLAINAHQVKSSRVSRQTVIIYTVWSIVMAVDLMVLLIASAFAWSELDTVTAAITLGGILAAVLFGRWRGIPVSDPIMRATFAVFYRAVPQLTLAYNIWLEGRAGISIVAFVAKHVIICLRLCQVWYSIREAGWDRNRLGIAIGEVVNELSWLVCTAVWIVVVF